jgi:hypothetical protein
MDTLFRLLSRMDKLPGGRYSQWHMRGIAQARRLCLACLVGRKSNEMLELECGQAGLHASQHFALNNGCPIRTAARLADQGAGPCRTSCILEWRLMHWMALTFVQVLG